MATVLAMLLLSLMLVNQTGKAQTPDQDQSVRVGVYQNKPLIFTTNNGDVAGIYADILHEIARREDWDLVFVPGDWNEQLTALEAGEIDLLTAIAFSEARAERFDFTEETIIANWGQIYVQTGSNVQSILDLENKPVAVLENDIHTEKFLELLQAFKLEVKLIKVDSYAEVFEAVANGAAEAGLVNRLYGEQNNTAYGLSKTSIIFNPMEIRIAGTKDAQQTRLAAIDRHINKMRVDGNSVYHQSIENWLGGEENHQLNIPGWVWGMLITGGVLIVLFAGIILWLQRRVHRQTKALQLQNQTLAVEVENRRQVAYSLRQSESRYRAIFENAYDSIFIIDPTDLHFTAVNQYAHQSLGYHAGELIGKRVQDISLPIRHNKLSERLKAIVSNSSFIFETEHVHKDGHTIPVEINASHFTEGNNARVLAIVRDISSRKAAEIESKRQNRQLRLLNRIIAAAVMAVDSDTMLHLACQELAVSMDKHSALAFLLNESGQAKILATHIRHGNQGFQAIHFNLADDSLLNRVLQDTQPAVVTASEITALPISQWVTAQTLSALLILPILVDRQLTGAMILGSTRHDSFSNAENTLGMRVAEQISLSLSRIQNTQTQQQLTTVIEQMAESLVITDIDGNIIYVNPSFEENTGYQAAEVLGNPPAMFRDRTLPPGSQVDLWATVQSGNVWRGRVVNQRKDGTSFTEEVTISPVRDEHDRIINYVSLQHDISRELALEEQSQQSQKMEAIGRLTGGIAHDFNNLLTAINGFAEMLEMKMAADDPLQVMVGHILKSGQRAADLVGQLLTFSRKQLVKLRPMDLNEAINNTQKMMRHIIGERIDIISDLQQEPWPIIADPSQTEQILLNLMVNARDAMPDGGQLTLKTRNITLSPQQAADMVDLEAGDYMTLTVQDTGIGMSPAVQEHVFEPFFTTKPTGEGTGLGLSTVFGIVKQCQGHITLHSKPNQGTTFTLYFPARQTDHAPPEALAPKIHRPGEGTILVVDDEPLIRDMTVNVLKLNGYQALPAGNGQEALDVALNHNGPIDLVLTDIMMPLVDGKTMADTLTKQYPRIKILFMSGYPNEDVTKAGIKPEKTAFIRKPFSPGMLLEEIKKMLTFEPNTEGDKRGD